MLRGRKPGYSVQAGGKLVALAPVAFPVKKPASPLLPERLGITLNILYMDAQGLADPRTTAHVGHDQVGQDVTIAVMVVFTMAKNGRTIVQVINKIIMGIKTDRRINHPGVFRENGEL